MEYTVKRGEETYGPYSLGDLQKYVRSGNIAMTDLTQSEGMSDWAPISQVIGTVPVPSALVYGMPMAQDPAVESVPLPPNLHWSLVLIINVVLRFAKLGVGFNAVWMLVLANWARKLDGNNNTLVYAAMYPASLIAGLIATLSWRTGTVSREAALVIGVLLGLGGLIAYFVGAFKIKAAMETYYNSNENIGLQLSGAMTFFFSSVYLQFHVNRIAKWKSTGILE
jgi:hypothetical protein